MAKFIGRQEELKKLLGLSKKKSASFIVVRGRRRIGKSRLIEEFSKYFDKFYAFEGLAPEKGVTAKDQLEEFSRQMTQQFNAPYARYDDWSNALWAVGERLKTGKVCYCLKFLGWELMNPHSLGK